MNASTDEASGFEVVAEIAVQRGAISGIAVSSDGRRLIVIHSGDDSFSLIDTGNHALTQRVVDVDEPFAVAIAPGGRAYVNTVSLAYDAILAFDLAANRVVATYPMALSVTDVAVSPNGRHVYASRTAPDRADVAILDTMTGTDDAIAIATTAATTTECVRVSPDGRRLYVATNAPTGAQLVVLDVPQKRVMTTVEIGSPIRDVALSPDGATAYITSCAADFGAVLDVVDTRANVVTTTCKVGEIAHLVSRLTLSRDGERLYLVGEDSVTVLSTSTHDVIGGIAVGSQPSCAIESPDGERLYIADYTGNITVAATPAPGDWALPDLLTLEPALA